MTRCANEPESLRELKSVDEQLLQDGVLGTRAEQCVSDGRALDAVLFEQWTERCSVLNSAVHLEVMNAESANFVDAENVMPVVA